MEKLKYTSSFKDRHGKTRWRFRRKGYQSTYLQGEFGTDEFMISYANALKDKIVVGQSRTKPRSFNDLAIRYTRSADFSYLSSSTQKVYRRILDKFRIKYGHLPVKGLKRKHIREIMEKMSESPTSANRLLSLLSIMLDLAMDLEWVDRNHARTIKKIKIRTVGHQAWTDHDLQKFEDFYPSGSRERLAYSLYLYTGQRGSDVVKMSRADILENTKQIKVVQQKTGEKLLIPIHPDLQRELACHKDNMMLILTKYGRPFSTKGFQQWYAKKARQAGLENRTGHGMRKSMGKRLAEAGCTPHQIAAITGHRSHSEILNYTRAANQEKLAGAAMSSLEDSQNV